MARIVIIGNGKMAQLAHFYFRNDSDHEVVAFSVNKEYIQEDSFCGLPLVPFEDIEKHYPPNQYQMFVAIAYRNLNKIRTEKYLEAKTKGYILVSYICSKIISWGDTKFGDNCFIFENQVFQPFVTIGNNVILWSGNHFGHDVCVGDNCFIASHAVLSGGVKIGNNSFIGINASIRDDVTIGSECIIGAHSVVLHNIKDKVVLISQQTEPYKLNSEEFERMMHISRIMKKK